MSQSYLLDTNDHVIMMMARKRKMKLKRIPYCVYRRNIFFAFHYVVFDLNIAQSFVTNRMMIAIAKIAEVGSHIYSMRVK